MGKTGCWALDYEPTLETLLINNTLKQKLKNFLKDKKIYMNLCLIGIDGCGKNTIIKTILDYCYNINIDKFKKYEKYENCVYYDSLYIFDFLNLPQSNIKPILDFITIFSRRTLFTDYEKVIILKHIENLEKYNLIKILKNIIEKNMNHCKFIISSNKKYKKFDGLFCSICIPKLNNKELNILLNNMRVNNQIKNNKNKINNNLIYKIYKDSFYNLKDTLLWYQYYIKTDKSSRMLIKNKIICSLINYIFYNKYDLTNLENIRDKLTNIISIGITELEILKTSVTVILLNKKVVDNIKTKVIMCASNINNKICLMDRPIFALENFFYEIYMYNLEINK